MMASYVNLIGYIQAQIRTFRIAWMFRVINQRHAATPLNAIPAPSRFSDPAGNFAVLYGAETLPCSLWEAVVRNSLTRRQRRVIPRPVITYRLVVSFQSQQDLNLVDLRGDGPIRWCSPRCCPRREPPRRPFIIRGCPCLSSIRRWISVSLAIYGRFVLRHF